MNAKKETPESPYIHEEVPTTPWLKSKAGKLTAVITGGVVALGAAFGAGVAVGSHEGREFDRNGAFGFDRDGDHRPPAGPGGQLPPRPGDHDGDGGGFQAPNPNPSASPGVQNN